MSALSPHPPPPPPPPPTTTGSNSRRMASSNKILALELGNVRQEVSKPYTNGENYVDNAVNQNEDVDILPNFPDNSVNDADTFDVLKHSAGFVSKTHNQQNHPSCLRNGSIPTGTGAIPSGASSVSSTSGSTTGSSTTRSITTVSAISLQQQNLQSRIASTVQSPQLECDYDLSPTPLYVAIEGKQWKVVMDILENDADDNRRTANRRPCPLTPKQQAACWVVRKGKDGRLRWRLLPIHAAIIFDASSTVIEALLEAYPASAFQKDDQGMLPLHLAFRNITLLLSDSQESNKSGNRSRGAMPTTLKKVSDTEDGSRPCATLSSTCQSTSSTAVNWLIVEELLTAFPQAIFSKDRKGRTPVQGGLFAAQQALKSEAKQNRQSINTPNHRKMAALKVLELYSQIAVAGEKNKWSKESLQKNNLRLAAVAEQHAYRLQEFQMQFLGEQAKQQARHNKQLAEFEVQLESLRQNNDKLQDDILIGAKELQLSKDSSDQKKIKEQERMILELTMQNKRLKNQVASLATNLRNSSLELQKVALDAEMMLDACEDKIVRSESPLSVSPSSSQVAPSQTTLTEAAHVTDKNLEGDGTSNDIGANTDTSEESQSAESVSYIVTESPFTTVPISTTVDANDDQIQQDSHRRQSSNVSTSSLTRFFGFMQSEDTREWMSGGSRNSLPTRLLEAPDVIEDGKRSETITSVGRSLNSAILNTDQLSYQSQECVVKDQWLLNEASTSVADGRVDSRDEDREEYSHSTSRKQDSTEEEGDANVDKFEIPSINSSNSVSFEELKNEILGHTTVPESIPIERKNDFKSVVFDSVIKKQRILPLITIRSDDETDMIATMVKQCSNNHATQSSKSQCSVMPPSASNGFADVVGASCVAEAFFMSSDTSTVAQKSKSPERIPNAANGYNSGPKNAARGQDTNYPSKQKAHSDQRRSKRHSLPDTRQVKSAIQSIYHQKTSPSSSNQLSSLDSSQSPVTSNGTISHVGGETSSSSQPPVNSTNSHATKNSRNVVVGKTKASITSGSDPVGCNSNVNGAVSTLMVGTCTTSAVGTSNCSRSLFDTEDDE